MIVDNNDYNWESFMKSGRAVCSILIICMWVVLPIYAQVISIDSIEELQLIGNDPAYPRNGSYVLSQDIDASATSGWNDGRGFQPIGECYDPFCGILDGQGHKIIGLYINRPDESYVGIFRYVGTKIIRMDGRTIRDICR